MANKESIMMTIILDPDEDIVVCFTMLLPPGLYQVTWSLYNRLDSGKSNYIYLYKQVRWGEMLLYTINDGEKKKNSCCFNDDDGKIVVCHNGTKSKRKTSSLFISKSAGE